MTLTGCSFPSLESCRQTRFMGSDGILELIREDWVLVDVKFHTVAA